MRPDALPAFYLRLSQADGDKVESDSIENQRKLLMRYIGKMPDFGGSDMFPRENVEHLEYIDDGYSGKDFNRPAIQRLITDCRKGKVSAILVKDLSRLGRDYLEVTSYLEDIFPFLRVRFISITDRYDSGEECNGEMSFDIQLSNLINTYYLRDIAIKSAAGRVSKWKRGELASTCTPIGYVCSDVKTGWKVEEGGAEIVRLVFDLAISGFGTGAIARELNERGIPTPYRYLKSNGLWRGVAFTTVEEKMVWDSSSVLSILRNESYTGMLIQGKTQAVVLGKGISRTAPDSMRFKHKDKHEPIVSREEFTAAQAVIKQVSERKEKVTLEYSLKGVVRCRNCGRLMRRNKIGTFSCKGTGQKEFTGCGGTWKEEELEKVVLEQLVKTGRHCEELLGAVNGPAFDAGAGEAEIQRLKDEQMAKYDAYVNGDISRDEYRKFQEKVKEQIAGIEVRVTVAKGTNAHNEELEEALRPLVEGARKAGNDGLTESLVKALIKNVWVGDEIEVEFRAAGVIRIAEDELVG